MQPARKRLAWVTYIVIILLLLGVVVWLRSIMLPFVIALLISFILGPMVTRLQGVGVARWLGVILVYVGLAGLTTLFLRFLVPIINNEAGKLLERSQVVLKETPKMYEKLEGGVGQYLDKISGVQAPEEIGEPHSVVVKDEDWGFGPPVHKIPSVSPPALSTVERLSFGSSDEAMSDAGLPKLPKLSAVRLEGGKALLMAPEERQNSLTVEQVKPGVFGINLGTGTVEVRKVGEGTYTFAAKDQDYEASQWDDLKAQVIGSMRKGLQEFSGSLLGGFFTFFQGLVSGIMNALVGFIVVFLVGAFVMIDTPSIMSGMRNNVPRRFRSDWDELLDRLNQGLSGVVRGQLLICLVNGLLTTVGFLIFIPEYAVVLGILAGVMSLIPIFGTIISSVPAILIALSMSFGHALGVLAWIMGIHFVEAYLLNPNIIGRQARIHPVVVVFVLIAGESLYGMKGILLAVPATSVAQSFIQFGYSRVKKHVI